MLNEKQQLAVNSTSRRILCLAGAGTGKTKTLISRVEKLLDNGVNPCEILCLTFTRLAGIEMKDRLGEKSHDIFINTFHSFCSKIIRENLKLFGLSENYSIYGQNQRESTLLALIKELKMEKEKIKTKDIMDCISFDKEWTDTPHRRANIIAKEYRYHLKCRNTIDIDLLVLDVVRILNLNKDLSEAYHNTYKYVFIDEFQDTNDSQMNFINAINPEFLFLVGDDYQAIYGFNNAKVEYILDISKNPKYEVIRLEDNYRSTSQIVAVANNLISHNAIKTEKKLIAHKEGPEIHFNECNSLGDEVNNILKVINRSRIEDYCIITRTNSQISEISKILSNINIPYRILGKKIAALESNQTKDLFDLIELIKNPLDNSTFDKFLWKIEALDGEEIESLQIKSLEEEISCYELLLDDIDLLNSNEKLKEFMDFIEESNLEELWDYPAADCLGNLMINDFIVKRYNQVILNELMTFMIYWTKVQTKFKEEITMNEFINWFKFSSSYDIDLVLQEEMGKGINITTAHSSKGLEFPIVFLVGMNEGIFPHSKDDIEESRRLCFVAITRAKEELYVSWSRTKKETWSKDVTKIKPSIFIQEMKTK